MFFFFDWRRSILLGELEKIPSKNWNQTAIEMKPITTPEGLKCSDKTMKAQRPKKLRYKNLRLAPRNPKQKICCHLPILRSR